MQRFLLKIISLPLKLIKSLKFVGVKRTFAAAKYRLKGASGDPYGVWMKYNVPTNRELKQQRGRTFAHSPLISIVLPAKNADAESVRDIANCFINQTYSNWELYIEDCGDKPCDGIENAFKSDNRIKYRYTPDSGFPECINRAFSSADGEYFGIVNYGDLLSVDCLFETVKAINEAPAADLIYTDSDEFNADENSRFDPCFKPDFGIDTLRSKNYVSQFSLFSKRVFKEVGGIRPHYYEPSGYDLIIRIAEIAKSIKHVPKVLYHVGSGKPSFELEKTCSEICLAVLKDHLLRVGLKGEVSGGAAEGTYRIDYELSDKPKVTVLIPNCNQADTLKTCVNSVLELTTYGNYEIVIIENNSTKRSAFDYYESLKDNNRIKVLYYPEKGFNYSKIINYGVENSDGEYIVQLNNDTKLLTPDWLEIMVGMCKRPDVGCVGVKLYYPDMTVQHAGVVIGIGGGASHVFKGLNRNERGYMDFENVIRNVTAVTAACMMTKRSVFLEVGCMEEKLAVAFNDVDYCMKVVKSGRLVIYNPFVELLHYESKSRGVEDTFAKELRFYKEVRFFIDRWRDELKSGDRYYNPNLRLDTDKCEIKEEKVN